MNRTVVSRGILSSSTSRFNCLYFIPSVDYSVFINFAYYVVFIVLVGLCSLMFSFWGAPYSYCRARGCERTHDLYHGGTDHLCLRGDSVRQTSDWRLEIQGECGLIIFSFGKVLSRDLNVQNWIVRRYLIGWIYTIKPVVWVIGDWTRKYLSIPLYHVTISEALAVKQFFFLSSVKLAVKRV